MQKYTIEELANPTADMLKEFRDYMMELTSKKPVWFMISERFGKYYITMFYDNEYNLSLIHI